MFLLTFSEYLQSSIPIVIGQGSRYVGGRVTIDDGLIGRGRSQGS